MLRRRPPLLAFDDEEDEIERSPFTALRGSLWPSSVTTNETRADPLKSAPGAVFQPPIPGTTTSQVYPWRQALLNERCGNQGHFTGLQADVETPATLHARAVLRSSTCAILLDHANPSVAFHVRG